MIDGRRCEGVKTYVWQAVYHFFRYEPRISWRTISLAGHMLMELGLHSRDVPHHILRSDRKRTEVVAIICSTYVLDRQFSAATGLPTTFQQSFFQQALKSQASLTRTRLVFKVQVTIILLTAFRSNHPI